MKILLLFVLSLALLSSCTKKSVPTATAPTVTKITYNFSAINKDTYILGYTDANAIQATETLSGNTWSKTFTILNTKDFYTAIFGVVDNNPYFINSGSMSISVNGVVKISNSFSSYSENGLFDSINYTL